MRHILFVLLSTHNNNNNTTCPPWAMSAAPSYVAVSRPFRHNVPKRMLATSWSMLSLLVFFMSPGEVSSVVLLIGAFYSHFFNTSNVRRPSAATRRSLTPNLT